MQIDDTRYTAFTHPPWQGYHLNTASDWVGGTDLVQHALTHPHEPIHQRTGADTWLIQSPTGPVYLKHTKALKNTHPDQSPPLAHKLKWRYLTSRAMHTLDITLQMNNADILTPQTLLAARATTGLDAADILITQPIDGQPLNQFLAKATLTEKQHFLSIAGAEIAKLHNAGFTHGDCIPANTFLTADQQRLVFLDNDRSQRSTRLQHRNLNQFLYRIILYNGYKAALSFMHAYDNTRQFNNQRTRLKNWRRILKHTSKRTQRQYLKRLFQPNRFDT